MYRERVVQCADAAHALGVSTLRDVSDPATVELIDEPVLRARARHVVTENRRVLEVVALLDAGRLAEIGPHLIASHESLRDDYGVSTPALDLVVDTALGCGALGARMTGAGLGGSVLVLAEQSVVPQIAYAVQKALVDKGFWAARGAVSHTVCWCAPSAAYGAQLTGVGSSTTLGPQVGGRLVELLQSGNDGSGDGVAQRWISEPGRVPGMRQITDVDPDGRHRVRCRMSQVLASLRPSRRSVRATISRCTRSANASPITERVAVDPLLP